MQHVSDRILASNSCESSQTLNVFCSRMIVMGSLGLGCVLLSACQRLIPFNMYSMRGMACPANGSPIEAHCNLAVSDSQEIALDGLVLE